MLSYTHAQLRAAFGIACALIILVVSISSAAPAAAQFQQIPVASVLNPDGTINTSRGVSGALDMRGWNVTLDSKRGPVLAPQGAPASAPNAGWSALANNGLNNVVVTLAVSGSDLYVGGEFTQTADGAVTNLNFIAKYSGVWSPLANSGLTDYVSALAVIDRDLYVGGWFLQTADGAVTNLNRIAKYSNNTWSPLANNGLNGFVFGLAVSGTDLYVGGNFYQTADGAVKNLSNIAKFTVGSPPTCNVKPGKPKLKAPANNGTVTATKPTLKWKETNCADAFNITIQDAVTGIKVEKKIGWTALNFKMTKALSKGKNSSGSWKR